MNKLQASMRDNSAKSWKANKTYFKVGSCFKGCRHCGDTEMRETKSGGEYEHWLTGTSVFRSYCPKHVGWTYWCWDCGAKDAAVWDDAWDLGMEPIINNPAKKAEVRKKYKLLDEEVEVKKAKAPSRASQIESLQAQLAELMEQLKGAVKESK